MQVEGSVGGEMAWVKIAEINQVPSGTGAVVRVGTKAIALFNIDGTFYALDNVCTHRGGPLGEGRVDGTVVTCPWHGNQFDVTTGQVILGTRPVTTYAVRTEGDGVLIDLPP
jgi:nitrite reductase/ring-hydroxylating ferredoxin subunit